MVSSLPGQSVGLLGHPSHVASCLSHSACIEKPNAAGVSLVLEPSFNIKCAEHSNSKIFLNHREKSQTRFFVANLPRETLAHDHSILNLPSSQCSLCVIHS